MNARLRGYVLCWGDIADLRDCLETFSPRCFTLPIAAALTLEHQDRTTVARGGRLRLTQDDTGLRLEADGDGSRGWRAFAAAIRAGARGCSFTFVPLVSKRDAEMETITKARLREICASGDPCYRRGALWFADEDPRDMPAHVRDLEAKFRASAR